jgi:hypothetical protein
METHFNNAAGVPRGVLLIATNAGYKGTKAEVWKKMALRQKKWSVHVWDRMAPWLNIEDVEDAKEMNTKSEFTRLFGKPKGGDNWASGKGDALSEESIDRVFRAHLKSITKRNGSVLDAELNKHMEGWDFLGGLDLGISHDHAGLVVIGVHREKKLMRVAFLKDWAPSIRNTEGKKIVDISSIRKTIKFVYDRFRTSWFGYDPAAGGHIIEQDMRREGVWMSEMRFTGVSLNEMAIAYMQVMESGVLQSFENEALRRDLGKFDIKKKPFGYKLEAMSDAYGHADVGTGLVITLPKAIILMGGLPSENSGFLIDVPAEPGEEEIEITDPDLMDILEEDERECEYRKMMESDDPFADFF